MQRFNVSTRLFDKHRRPITQYFSDPRRNLRRVITNPDDRVGAEFSRMGQHLAKRVVAGPFAQVRVKPNVATEQTLNPRADVPDDRPGAHDQYPGEWVHATTEAAAVAVLNTTRGEGAIAAGARARKYVQQWSWDEVRHLWGRILLGAELPLVGG